MKESHFVRHFYFILLVFCLLPSFAFSSEKQIPVLQVKSILVKNFSGNILLKKTKGPYRFNMNGTLFLKNRNGNVEIKSSLSYESLNDEAEGTQLKVYGPGVPVSLFIETGKVNIEKWNKELFVSAKKAQIQGKNTQGDWTLALTRGKLRMENHAGFVRLKGFHSNIDVKNIKGDINFQFNEGSLKMGEVKAPSLSQFETHKGSVNITKFTGDLKGFSTEGKVRLSRLRSKKVEIETGTAPIYLFSPNKSLYVSAYSEQGKIYAPKHFYKKLSGRSQTAKGWLAGSSSKAKAQLKTDTGSIYIQ